MESPSIVGFNRQYALLYMVPIFWRLCSSVMNGQIVHLTLWIGRLIARPSRLRSIDVPTLLNSATISCRPVAWLADMGQGYRCVVNCEKFQTKIFIMLFVAPPHQPWANWRSDFLTLLRKQCHIVFPQTRCSQIFYLLALKLG
jgi:hypothetical protein